MSNEIPSVEDSIKAIAMALRDDPTNYGWSWQSNIAMAFVDEGGDHKMANRAAARFLKQCFDYDSKTPDGETPWNDE